MLIKIILVVSKEKLYQRGKICEFTVNGYRFVFTYTPANFLNSLKIFIFLMTLQVEKLKDISVFQKKEATFLGD